MGTGGGGRPGELSTHFISQVARLAREIESRGVTTGLRFPGENLAELMFNAKRDLATLSIAGVVSVTSIES